MLEMPTLNDMDTVSIMQESLTHLESQAEDKASGIAQPAAAKIVKV